MTTSDRPGNNDARGVRSEGAGSTDTKIAATDPPTRAEPVATGAAGSTRATSSAGPTAIGSTDVAEARRQAAVDLGVARTRNRVFTDLGLLVLRLLSVVMFLHGLAKITDYSAFRTTVANNSVGALAPDVFAILVVAGQLALPIAIAFGLLTRLSGLLLAVMMGVIWVLFGLVGGLLDPETGGIAGETAYLYGAIGLTLFFTGAGRFSLDHALFGSRARARAERRAEKKLA